MKTIKSFNEFLDEKKNFDFDIDDYKYDPEYYLENDVDVDIDEMDSEDDEENDDDDDFSMDLIVARGDKREHPKPRDKKEVNHGFYSFEESVDLYDKLKNDQLKRSEIDPRALSALLNIGAIEFHKNKTHLDKVYHGYIDYKYGTFGFVKKKGDKMEPLLQIRGDIGTFRTFINNAIQSSDIVKSLTQKFFKF